MIANIELPDPSSFGALGWLLVGIAGLITLVGTVAGVGLTLMALVEKIRGKKSKPSPTHLAQPITIQHVDQFVKVTDFNQKFESIDRRFIGIELQIEKQVKATDVYMHDMRHEIRNELQTLTTAADARDEKLGEKLDTHWQQLNRERSTSTARLHDKVEASNQIIRQEIDTKVSAIHAKIDEVPGRLVTMLTQTGVIGRKARE